MSPLAGGRRADLAAVAVLVGLVTLLLAPVVLRGELLLPLDLRDRWQPWRSELRPEVKTPHNPLVGDALWEAYPMAVQAQRLWRSGLPLWDPTAMIGMPALAAGKMYSNPVYLALATAMTPEGAMSWAAVLHLLIATVGMYLLLRELGALVTPALLGACAFGFNGYLLVWLSLTYFVGTMVWIPLLFWAIERALRRRDGRWLVVAAMVFAVQILAGFVLFAAHSGLLVALVYGLRAGARAWREKSIGSAGRPALYGAVAIAGGVALAAFQFLPTIELFQQTGRGGRQFAEVLPAHEMVRLLVPGIAGTPLDGEPYEGAINYAEATLYFGTIPLLCLLAACFGSSGRRRRTALVFFGIGLVFWLAVYGVTPCYQLVQAITPGFRATFAGRVFFIVAFCWSLVAGLGADALLRSSAFRRRGWWAALATVGALLAVVRYLESWWTADDLPLVQPASIGASTAFLVAGGAAIALLRIPRLPRGLIGLILVALTAGDLLSTHADWNTTTPERDVLPITPNLERLTRPSTNKVPALPKRIAAIHGAHLLPGMSAQGYGLSNVSGYSSWISERYSRYLTLTGNRAKPFQMNRVSLSLCCGPLLDALAIDWVYAAPNVQRLDLDGLLIDQLASARQASRPSPSSQRVRLDGRPRRALILTAPDRISFALDPTTPQRLSAAIGLDWRRCAATDGVRFKVRVRTRDGQLSTRFDQLLVPRDGEQPAWVPIDVSLRDDPQQQLERVLLIAQPGSRNDARCDRALWAEPRIHHQPESAPSMRRVVKFRNPLYRNLEALPRARLVYDSVSIAPGDLDAAQRFLRDPAHNLGQTAVIEGVLPQPLGPAAANDRATITTFGMNRLTLDVRAENPALLVLAEAYHPGWRARVDGVATPVLATNLTLRGVAIPAGHHRVSLYFRPTSFVAGRAISAVTLATLIACLIVATRRSRCRPHTTINTPAAVQGTISITAPSDPLS